MAAHFNRWGLFALLLLSGLAACQSEHAKLNTLMRGGGAEFRAPTDTLPFVWQDSLMVVRASLAAALGRPARELRLVVATEMPTALSAKLAAELALSPVVSFPLLDDQARLVSDQYAVLPRVSLAYTDFTDTGVGILLDSVADWLQARHVDGVLGANLMQHGVWYIDFAGQRLILAPDERPFAEIVAGAEALSFVRDVWRTPKFQVSINQFPRKPFVRLSTGFAGGLKLPNDWYEDRPSMFFTAEFPVAIQAQNHSGLLLRSRSGGPDTTFWATTKQLELGKLFVPNAPTQLRRDVHCRLGLGVLRRFQVVINWPKRVLYLRASP